MPYFWASPWPWICALFPLGLCKYRPMFTAADVSGLMCFLFMSYLPSLLHSSVNATQTFWLSAGIYQGKEPLLPTLDALPAGGFISPLPGEIDGSSGIPNIQQMFIQPGYADVVVELWCCAKCVF